MPLVSLVSDTQSKNKHTFAVNDIPLLSDELDE